MRVAGNLIVTMSYQASADGAHPLTEHNCTRPLLVLSVVTG